ncbi:MAG: elongation factor P, partial [Bdellovibrionota bacterium]
PRLTRSASAAGKGAADGWNRIMGLIGATDIRLGMLIQHEGKLCSVLKVEHRTPGNLRGFVQARMRDINSGSSYEHRFRTVDKVEQVSLDHKQMEFLYAEGDQYHFMENETYEQLSLPADVLGDAPQYMLPNTKLQISFYEGKPIAVELPTAVELKVVEAEPGMRTATASASKKNAKLETGLSIQVPQFVEVGNIVKVDTRDGSYLDRVG